VLLLRIDEMIPGAVLPPSYIPMQGKISTRRFWATLRNRHER